MNTPPNVCFQETQRFTQWWMWIFALIPAGIGLYGCYVQLYLGIPFGDKPMSDVGLILFTLLGAGFGGFLGLHKLTTTVSSATLTVQFFPYTHRKISLEDIEEWSVIPYDFVGGWGVRLWTKYGTVYNVQSGMGLFIIPKNKKRFLVGTQQAEALKRAMENQLKQAV